MLGASFKESPAGVGVVVSAVAPDSAAATAGLMPDMRILTVNNALVVDTSFAVFEAQLRDAFRSMSEASPLTLTALAQDVREQLY
jgi:predicted metalloprotease with PDZ domain